MHFLVFKHRLYNRFLRETLFQSSVSIVLCQCVWVGILHTTTTFLKYYWFYSTIWVSSAVFSRILHEQAPSHPRKHTDMHTHTTPIPICHWHHIQSYLNGSQCGCRQWWYSRLNRDTMLKATVKHQLSHSAVYFSAQSYDRASESGQAGFKDTNPIQSQNSISPLLRHDFIDFCF